MTADEATWVKIESALGSLREAIRREHARLDIDCLCA
jgi:hypothetical protein